MNNDNNKKVRYSSKENFHNFNSSFQSQSQEYAESMGFY